VFEAKSHFEAMTLYYNRMGWGEYQTEQQWDIKPYPAEWIKIQAKTAQEGKAFHKAKLWQAWGCVAACTFASLKIEYR